MSTRRPFCLLSLRVIHFLSDTMKPSPTSYKMALRQKVKLIRQQTPSLKNTLYRPPKPPVNRERIARKTSPENLQQMTIDYLQEHRILASKTFARRDTLLEDSIVAFKKGDKLLASELSGEAKALYSVAQQHNSTAAARVFHHYNPSLETEVVDLHGLYSREAVYYLCAHIQRCIHRGEKTVVCVVGKGNNSLSGGSRLLPTVLELCKQLEVTVVNGGEDGVVVISLV